MTNESTQDVEREAFEAAWLSMRDDPESPYMSTAKGAALWAWKAGRASLLAEMARMEPVAWLVEFGAVSLPKGHPSRITDFEAHHNEADALADAQACDYDTRVFAVIARPQPDAPEGGETQR